MQTRPCFPFVFSLATALTAAFPIRAQQPDAGTAAAVPANAAAAPAAPPAPDPRIPSFSAKEQAVLDKGQVVVRGGMADAPGGGRIGKGVAYVIINRPPQDAFAILQDYDKTPQFMPRLKKVTIKQRTPEHMKVVQVLHVFLFKSAEYTLDLNFDAAHKRMSWTLDKKADNDIKDTFGSWNFVPYRQGKTLVVYEIAVDTGVALPGPLENYLTKRDLPGVLMAVKKRTESGGRWTKD